MSDAETSARDAAVRVVARLRDAGHTAYFAGGCVRDALLGLEPQDYDVATDARPEQVRKLFRRSKLVGESFGVVRVREARHDIEVATFRLEWAYEDHRRPSKVQFTDAEHDARRRDFTINGLFADPLEHDDRAEASDPTAPPGAADRIIDYVGGGRDLKAGLIRAIGDPDERFGEDYLRMLRAVRFASRFGFQIEPKTAAAITAHAKHLGQISRERIGQELLRMFAGARRAESAAMIQALRLDGPTLHEDHLDGPLTVLRALSDEASPATALAAWMIDRHVAEPELDAAARFAQTAATRVVSTWRKALCLSNEVRDDVRRVLTLTADAAHWHELDVARRKRLLASPQWGQALRLVRALSAERAAEIERDAEPLVSEGVAPQPWVTGEDLIAMGMRPGPKFGELLERVYDAQLEGRVRSRDEALRWIQRAADEAD